MKQHVCIMSAYIDRAPRRRGIKFDVQAYIYIFV